jgi:two-component system, NtrC family, sensor kinase
MEDKSDSRTQKPSKLLVFLEDPGVVELISPKIRSLFELSRDSESCDISVVGRHGQLKIVLTENKKKAFNVSAPNLNNLLKLTVQLKKVDNKPLKQGLRQSPFRPETIAFKNPRSADAKRFKFALSDQKVLNDLFDESLTISGHMKLAFELSLFNSYSSVQLIVHEKGKTEADAYSLLSSEDFTQGQITATLFNQLFSTIKKSKSKIFNSTVSALSALNSIGSFLAKEFEYPDFNCLFVITRNEFLPLSQEEHLFFGHIHPYLRTSLHGVILRARFSDKERSLISILNSYPLPIRVDVGENSIFKNRAYHQQSSSLQDPKVLSLGYDQNLYVWDIHQDVTLSDIHHHQRLSLLGELLNTLKHELSNPLFGLKLTSQFLEIDSSSADSKEIFEDIKKSCNRCDEIISTFSKLYIESDDIQSVDLEFLIKEVFVLAKSESREIIKNLKLYGAITIQTHPTWLTQILFNLVINAVQAIKSTQQLNGQILITAEETHDSVAIHIIDNGPGIAPELYGLLTRPYFTTKSTGTGLGLSICRRLCDRLGASLSFANNESSPGATFSVVLRKI